MDYIAATHNLKKRDELTRMLSPLGIKIHIAEELGIELTDVEETGTTFEENAFLKAKNGCDESGFPCIADDSGLEVDALNGEPGIYSARYAGEHGNDEKNNVKLLNELKNVPSEKRTGRFVSAVCCVWPDGRTLTVRGECEGKIAFGPSGSGGFGYDPVFIPEETAGNVAGVSMALLSAEQKDEISHRGKALKKLVNAITEMKEVE